MIDHRFQCNMILLLVLMLLSMSAMADELYSAQPLLAEPFVTAEVIGEAKEGPISALERQGFWIKVQSGSLIGWTKLSHVQLEEMPWMDPIDSLHDTGRLGGEQ